MGLVSMRVRYKGVKEARLMCIRVVNWYRTREVNFEDELPYVPNSFWIFYICFSDISTDTTDSQSPSENNRRPCPPDPSDKRRRVTAGSGAGNGTGGAESDEKGGGDVPLGALAGAGGGQCVCGRVA